MQQSEIKLGDIVFDGAIYPRQKPSTTTILEYADSLAVGSVGTVFPPIIVEADTNRLLDGYHRWKAYLEYNQSYTERLASLSDGDSIPDPFETVPCEFHIIPDGIPAKLYAGSLSRRNGLRWADSDKKATAREVYNSNPGFPISALIKYCDIPRKKASLWINDLVASFQEKKNTIIERLNMLGWTQQEIADKLQEIYPEAKGTSQDEVSRLLRKSGENNFCVKILSDLQAGHPPAKVAKRAEVAEILVWAVKLQNLPDDQRVTELDIKTQPYDVWHFQRCHDLFGTDYPGRIPGDILVNLLYFFTAPGNVIVDPMVGSGTTIDVALAMGRKCYGYDLTNAFQRPDVLIHDMADGWPDRVKKASLVFWDPPYFDKKDDEYVDGSISRLGRDEYLMFFADRFKDLRGMVKTGTRLAFLMSDWNDHGKPELGIFLWHYADLLREAGWTLERQIQVPLSTQQIHPGIVKDYREKRKLTRLGRYLLIATA